MRIRLVRPYQTRPAGAILNTVPPARALRMIKNGVAIPVEEKKKNDNTVKRNQPE
jgi:hypothetical protein